MKSLTKFIALILLIQLNTALESISQETLPKGILSNVPGAEHRFLYEFHGKWRQLYSGYVDEGENSYGMGITENKMIMDNRFLEMSADLVIEKVPVRSLIILGFDRSSERFVFFGIDNFGTNPTFSYGNYSKNKDSIIFLGEFKEPITEKEYKYRLVIALVEKTKYIYHFYLDDGKRERLVIEKMNIKIEE